MNIDTDLMLTIASGILLASLVKHIVVVAANQLFRSSGSASREIGSASSHKGQ